MSETTGGHEERSSEVLTPELERFLPEVARTMLIVGVMPNPGAIDFSGDEQPIVKDGEGGISEYPEPPEMQFLTSVARKWQTTIGQGDFEHDMTVLIRAIRERGGPTAVLEAQRNG